MSIISTTKKKKYIYRIRVSFTGSMLPFLLMVQLAVSAQTTYYVANSGNDANNGTSVSTPFQSLAKVSGLSLNPGDQVLFRRGDTFRGTLTIRRSGSASRPVIFDAYGSGAKPILSGSTPVTNWTSAGNNIWQAPCPSCGNAVTGVYRNGTALPLGRYPNADGPNQGNLTIRAHTEKYQIFSQEPLPYNIDWKGAEVVMRPTAWIIDRAVVDAQYGDALNLFNYSTYYPADNSVYFFQNHPATLDQNGEWCYDQATKKILIYNEYGNPSADKYTATIYGRGVDIANVSNVTLRNLQISETLNTSINGQNVSNLILTNLDVINSGEDGIIILGSGTNLLLENNKVLTANNNGVWIDPYQTVTLRGNSLRRIGIFPGRGKSGDGQYNGVSSFANQNVLIENNVIDSVGYNGITFRNNTTIKQNVIANYCFIKIDGGGIYAHNGNKEPMSNIHLLSNILYTKPAGNTPWRDYSIGIFLDDCVENVDVIGNTVFGNTQWGIFLHGSNKITLTDNTLFDNSTCQLAIYHNAGYCPIREDIIKRNVIVSKTAIQLVAQFESNADDLVQYGSIDSNYYARPFDENGLIRGVINYGEGGNFNLSEWKNFSKGLDIHSLGSPITYNQYKAEGSGGVARVNTTFDGNNDNWQLVYSPYGNAEVVNDNTNKLDGGSLRVSFPVLSGQPNSYAQVVKPFGPISRGQTYVLRFDAVSTTDVSISVYLRQYGPPYREFDRRYTVALSANRTSYELLFTSTDYDGNAVIMVQTATEGPVFWLDNVRLQEGIPIQSNADDFIKLYYNPTLKDSTVILPAGTFRDVKNQAYANSLIVKPFSSVILLRDTIPVSPADLSLELHSDKRIVQVNEPATIRLRIRNQGNTDAELARWTYRLPANCEFLNANGQLYSDNVLTGTVSQLAAQADTTFVIVVRPTVPGLFQMSAHITTATSYDPDSKPNTGTLDGEDDAATTEIRVDESATVYKSPNPNQRLLPAVASNQPVATPNRVDLSLQMSVSKRVLSVGDVVSYSLIVSNAGGLVADGVQVENVLPNGVELVEATGWTVSGRTLRKTLASIPVGGSTSAVFQVRVTASGLWINQAQISVSTTEDADSTPGNGFTTGEDDQAQVDIRVR